MKSLSEMTDHEYFACVGRRPGMFAGKTSFHMLTAFLTGCDQRALRHGDRGLTGRHDWLVARRGRDCNHIWSGQVLHIALPNGWDGVWNLPSEDEQHAIKALFELLDEFAAESEAARGAGLSDRVRRQAAPRLAQDDPSLVTTLTWFALTRPGHTPFHALAMTSHEGTHPTVLVRVGSRHARIDELLAPAVQAIWECGFDTFTCCQDLAESNAGWPEKLPHGAARPRRLEHGRPLITGPGLLPRHLVTAAGVRGGR